MMMLCSMNPVHEGLNVLYLRPHVSKVNHVNVRSSSRKVEQIYKDSGISLPAFDSARRAMAEVQQMDRLWRT